MKINIYLHRSVAVLRHHAFTFSFATAMSESGGSKKRPSSSKSRSSGRPTTAEYDRALQQDIMEEGNVDTLANDHRAPVSTQVKCAITGGVVLFVLVFTAVVIVDSIHTIEEGNVGIYFVQGALGSDYTTPGVHWSIPFVTTIEEITIRPQTETLEPISTVTKDGIQNTFHNIQVLSNVEIGSLIDLIRKFGMNFRHALIYDRVSEELRTFCANSTIDEVRILQLSFLVSLFENVYFQVYNTKFLDIVSQVKIQVEKSITRLGMNGIKILNLVIPKPDIPRDIAANYKAVKVQWTDQLVAKQRQITEKIRKETESIKAMLDAEREKNVTKITLEKALLQKENEKMINDLRKLRNKNFFLHHVIFIIFSENQIIKSREENQADVDAYKKEKDAAANVQLYTKDYVSLELAKELSKNTKFYFSGETSPLGGLLNKLLGE